jgi:hypothetical protein
MTEDEQRIADVQETLDLIADKIDTNYSDDNDAMLLRLIHAQGTALIHLLKKGQTDVEYKKYE